MLVASPSLVRISLCYSPLVGEELRTSLLIASLVYLFLYSYAWNSKTIISLYVVGGLLFGGFIWIESRVVGEPICPPGLFGNGSILFGFLGNFLIGVVFYSLVYYLPIFFQILRGDTATLSGIELIPLILVLNLILTISGQLTTRLGKW